MSKYTHSDYDDMLSRWTMARDATDDEHTVHSKQTDYLPRLNQEKDNDYKTRLNMTPFFGASWRTIIALRGMMFRKDPTIVIPDAFRDALDNIDNNGQSFVSFAQDVSLEALIVGRNGILTEFSQVSEGLTALDVKEAGLGPFLSQYLAESVLNWSHTNIGGRRILSMVRLLEDVENYAEFTEQIKDGDEIHRILRLTDLGYTQQVMIVNDKDETPVGDEIIPQMGGASMNFIPFQPIGVDSLTIDVEIPPLMDLISMNFHHYRQSSAYERGCFLTGFPTLFVYGNTDADKIIYIGGSSANSFPDHTTRAEFVSADTKLEALERNLERKEKQMAVLGARMLESQGKAAESGDAWERKQSGEESILADMSTTIGEGLTNSLKWHTEWSGGDPTDVNVELSKEFLPFKLTATEIQAMMGAYIQRGMSFDSLFYNFQRAGLHAPDTDLDDERGKIDESTAGLI